MDGPEAAGVSPRRDVLRVCAAGDVRARSIRRVASAVGA